MGEKPGDPDFEGCAQGPTWPLAGPRAHVTSPGRRPGWGAVGGVGWGAVGQRGSAHPRASVSPPASEPRATSTASSVPRSPGPRPGAPRAREEGLAPGPVGWGLPRHGLRRTEESEPGLLPRHGGPEASPGPRRPAQARWPGAPPLPGDPSSQPRGISGSLGPPPAARGSGTLSCPLEPGLPAAQPPGPALLP